MEDEENEMQEPAPAESGSGGGQNATKPHWRKNQEGKWVICGPENVMQPGALVEVFRKDGSSSVQKLSDDPGTGKPFESRDVPGEMLVYAYNFSEEK